MIQRMLVVCVITVKSEALYLYFNRALFMENQIKMSFQCRQNATTFFFYGVMDR